MGKIKRKTNIMSAIHAHYKECGESFTARDAVFWLKEKKKKKRWVPTVTGLAKMISMSKEDFDRVGYVRSPSGTNVNSKILEFVAK